MDLQLESSLKEHIKSASYLKASNNQEKLISYLIHTHSYINTAKSQDTLFKQITQNNTCCIKIIRFFRNTWICSWASCFNFCSFFLKCAKRKYIRQETRTIAKLMHPIIMYISFFIDSGDSTSPEKLLCDTDFIKRDVLTLSKFSNIIIDYA